MNGSDKGSIWRKWDLHVHTPASLVNYYNRGKTEEEIWENYLKELEALPKEFAVLGINDYLFIDGYKKIKEERERNGRLKNIQLILPVIEFRIKKFAGSESKLSRVNYHVIFSPELDPEIIQQHFLNALPGHYKLAPQYESLERDWKALATKTSLEELGKKIKTSVPEEELKNYGSDLQEGFNNINFNEEKIVEVLEGSSYFSGKYFTAVGKTEWADIKWTDQSIAEKKHVINKVDFVFISSSSIEDFNKSKDQLTKAKVNDLLFDCSDAHRYSDDQYKDRIGKCFTWVKADTTFEGLRQVLFEPNLRLSIQEDDPTEFETYPKINALKLNLPTDLKIKEDVDQSEIDFCLKGSHIINFSNNLTCIIGGRGSGKSTLAHLLYNNWVGTEKGKLARINSPLTSLKLGTDPLSELRKLVYVDIPPETEIYLQNEIEQFARDISGMSKLIDKRLRKLSILDSKKALEAIEAEWLSKKGRLDYLIKTYDDMVLILSNINDISQQIETLKKQVDVIKSPEYLEFQQKIKDITEKIFAFQRYHSDFQNLTSEFLELLSNLEKLNWTNEQGLEDIDHLKQTIAITQEKLQSKFALVKADYIQAEYTLKLNSVKSELAKYLKEKGQSAENIQDISSANEKIKTLEEEQKRLLLNVEQYKKVCQDRNNIIEEYKSLYDEYSARYREIFSLMTDRLKQLEVEDKKITFEIKVNYETLKDIVVNFIKINTDHSTSLQEDEIRKVIFNTLSTEEESELLKKFILEKDSILEQAKKFEGSPMHKKLILELLANETSLEKLYLKIVQEYYSLGNIQVQTKFGGRALQNTSFGERCGIVIAIILVAGTNPVIIDQPEDHLDSKFITLVLVPLLKEQKKHRQIIFISRDANIVIGGDADLMNILGTHEGATLIEPCTIEDLNSRDKYVWILDGGTDAFKKREQKYNLE